MPTLALVLLSLLAAALPAQKGSYSVGPSNCIGHVSFGPRWEPTLQALDVPTIGKQLRVKVDQRWWRCRQTILLTGASTTSFGGHRLPLHPGRYLRGRWCGTLQTSIAFAQYVSDYWVITLPNDKRLVGVTLYQQVWVRWGCPPLSQQSLSRLGTMKIGQ